MTKSKPQVHFHIANLEREVATGKVTTVHYTVDLESDQYRAGAYGSIGVDGDVTVAFKDLTEAVCIQWVKDQLGEERLLELGEALRAQIENQRAPKVASGCPWNHTDTAAAA
jgi:hypothetical protein